ncbi:MAG TPA: hypothetical protein VGR79_13150 [Stellaceae bacterium]|nr:hypothetical protein [Stellaceae bacterium]
MTESAIPVLSLAVALLAVFVGPLISWYIAKRQIESSLAVANKQIVAPMRQAWINNLRDILAELTSSALHYYVAGFEDRTDAEYRTLTLLEHKIQLMLNPQEKDHKQLEALIKKMILAIGAGRDGDRPFNECHPAVIDLSRKILKREWDRVKNGIPTAE